MKLFHLVSSVLALPRVGAYLVTPPGAAAPGSTTNCSGWVEQVPTLTCALIEQFFGVTKAQFEAWNPSTTELGANCTLIPDLYYCVQINFSTISTLVPGSSTSTPSSSSTAISKFVPTTTSTSTHPLCTGTPTGIAIASPAPSRAICDVQADSATLTGAGLLTAYNSPSPFVASLLACAAQCFATYACTNIYFVAGAKCNLHYGVTSYVLNTNGINAYSLYDISCFTGITLVSPTPTSSVCDVQADSATLTGAGLLTAYNSPSPFVTSLLACAAQCLATSTCTNIYFVAGAKCNLHYGPTSYVLNTNAVNAYSLYDMTCFTPCGITQPTPTGNGIPTPTPIQPSMVTNCDNFHLVVTGDQCGTLATNYGITLANFIAWNPAVGSTCATLDLGDYVCIGIL